MTNMTDLELTKLCAEAMGLKLASDGKHYADPGDWAQHYEYDPLDDDAQAMALVDKLLRPGSLHWMMDYASGQFRWTVTGYSGNPPKESVSHGLDLKRAIVECVAKMQKAKI